MSSKSLPALTAQIIGAYFRGRNPPVEQKDLGDLLTKVLDALAHPEGQASSRVVTDESREQLWPAVSIRKSVTNEYIICLEDGKKFKSLTRHIGAKYNLSPNQYRQKWGLPHDYPMTAPSYSKMRAEMAQQNGFGTREARDLHSRPRLALVSDRRR